MIKSLSKLETLLKDREKEIRRLRQNGIKVVGYVCCKTPVEIIHALGLLPIRLGRASEEDMALGKEFIHQFTCPYIKCIVGQMLAENSFLYENVDILSGHVSCLAVHRCLEVLKLYTGKPTVYLTFPLNPPSAREMRFYAAEVRWFASRLEELTGTKLNAASLENSVKLYNRIRKTLNEIYKRQASNNSSARWSDIFKLIHAGFLLDPNDYLALLKDVLADLDETENNTESKRAPRIMLAGSPIVPGDDLLIETIEETDARIVVDTLCTGLRTFEDLIVEEPTLEGIARTYLASNPCASAQDLNIETDRRLNHVLRLIKEYEVDGVVYYALRFCDHYAFKDDETKDFLAEKAGVPLLAIHSEYGQSEAGRLRTRLEAFFETLTAAAC